MRRDGLDRDLISTWKNKTEPVCAPMLITSGGFFSLDMHACHRNRHNFVVVPYDTIDMLVVSHGHYVAWVSSTANRKKSTKVWCIPHIIHNGCFVYFKEQNNAQHLLIIPECLKVFYHAPWISTWVYRHHIITWWAITHLSQAKCTIPSSIQDNTIYVSMIEETTLSAHVPTVPHEAILIKQIRVRRLHPYKWFNKANPFPSTCTPATSHTISSFSKKCVLAPFHTPIQSYFTLTC